MINDIVLLCEHYVSCQFGGKGKAKKIWTTFIHNGIMFPDPYKPHNVPLLVDGKKVKLPLLAEEYATLYSRYLDSEYAKSKTFHSNFFKSWKHSIKGLGIVTLQQCDFSLIKQHVEKQQLEKKSLSKEEKQIIKDKAMLEEEKYKIAIVDGKEQPVGNYKLEPPGIFIGRGCHPKMGTIKPRIMPGDITVNISKGAPIPTLPTFYSHLKFKKVVHDNTSQWLVSWKDTINKKTKYVWLSSKSDLKAKSDIEKFDKARKLKKQIKNIRKINFENLQSEEQQVKQLSTALFLIDNFALRVGNEKYEDEADTVGVTSLRYEHMFILENNTIKMDFLGKDSIRYVNKTTVPEQIYSNIKEFMTGKSKGDSLFDLINSTDLNNYIKNLGDFTAKVFRTFNASQTFQEEIDKISEKYSKYNKSDKLDMLLNSFNTANAKVAILCNHQKNVSKGYEEGMKKLKDKMLEYKKKIEDLLLEPESDKRKKKISKLKDKIKMYKMKKESKIELKNISLGTSKINYIDPRISVAFFKKHNIPLEKGFPQALRDRFFWAMEVDEDWRF